MASAAFKSNSRRGSSVISDNSKSQNKAPPKRRTQRSLSVSAVPRTHLDIESDFLNKRDNPLFLCTTPTPDKESQQPESASRTQINEASTSKSVSNAGQRGRSVTRNVDLRNKKTIGRSLSRGHYVYGASESEVEHEPLKSTNYRSTSNLKSALSNVKRLNVVGSGACESELEQESVRSSKYQNILTSNTASIEVKRTSSVRNIAGTLHRTRSLQSVSNRHPVIVPSDDSTTKFQFPSWEDEISTGSLSEAEEKTIKAVCEQMKSFQGNHLGADTSTSGIYETVRSEVRRAISDMQNDLETAVRRSNATGIATADVTSIPPDLVKPGAVELVSDIRREYARKLDESQERARKLRSDLAVEEHRGQELSRILEETLPDPKISNVQRSRLRRPSSERKKMSKRLTEEAMSYFDESVSISTFDSSDFSAPEDPPINATNMACSTSLPQESRSNSVVNGPNSCLNHEKEAILLMHSREESGLTANSSSFEAIMDKSGSSSTEWTRKPQFSFSCKTTTEPFILHQEIRSYIKSFEEDVESFDGIRISSAEATRFNSFNFDGYDTQGQGRTEESLLFDRVSYKTRIESGSLHLCTGGTAFSFSPFASIIM